MTFFIMMNHDLGYLWFQTHPIQTHRIPEDSGWIAQKGVPHWSTKRLVTVSFTQIKPRQLTWSRHPFRSSLRGSRFMEGVRHQMWRSQHKREVHRKPWTFAFWVAWITGKYMHWMCWRESERWECMNMGYTTNCQQFVAIFHGTMMIHQHIYGWHFFWQTAWSPAKLTTNNNNMYLGW